ncbi:uncharacterized protein N7515_002797 [Penicillium bovifimosum]|uniref:Uncharacterized protein n=1 Tax=Penicillium bovifimosum TaxID=126998 RepID=A0A9W9HCW6_9EURO|nr:uncharacterized protein N7515_002797 [Penicillium bovifimosum]KAJ5144010.1 hypothetical protein N7515_002797 [Penicillium bovifimosum]
MPAILSVAPVLEHALVHRAASSLNATGKSSPLEVVCAWPVSGQYGPGTRALYYVLIAACVVARKYEWIRNACLAAVLLFPAIAALHGIVLAALHVEGAVDMDVYGAFQLCAIGILTAPATVRISRTYFYNPGRDIIFLWTVLLLVGLISLIVEFMRLEPIVCPADDPASISWAATGNFTYGSNCSIACTPEDGPRSPLRLDAADNIFVIPVPTELSFNAATLIAAACCIPGILSLISMWIKILDNNGKKTSNGIALEPNQPIEGTNGATIEKMTGISEKIKRWLTVIGIPIFAAAVLAILIKGEMNFWSDQVRYQTEPIQSIGQWAPIVGTGLAALGSLYLLLSADMDAEDKRYGQPEGEPNEPTAGPCAHCGNCASSETRSSSRRESGTSTDDIHMTNMRRHTTNQTSTTHSKSEGDLGRRKVAQFLNRTSTLMAVKAYKQIERGGFNHDAKTTYPTTPGEEYKNKLLQSQQLKYQITHTPDTRSRAGSFISSRESVDNGEGSSRMSRSPVRQSVPAPTPARPRSRPNHANSLGALFEPSTSQSLSPGSLSENWTGGQLRPSDRRPSQRSRATSTSSNSDISPTTVSPVIQFPPKIVVSRSEESGG